MISFMISVVPPKIDVAEPPEPAIVPESGALWCSRRSRGAPCGQREPWRSRGASLGGDHPPGDRLPAWQLPEPWRGRDDDAEPAAADIPAIDADVDSGELIAA